MKFRLPRLRHVGTDPRSLLLERARRDERMLSVVRFLDREAEIRAGNELPATAADGNYYVDTRTPFVVADQTAIAGTAEALLWPFHYTFLPADYFNVGKMVYILAAGKITTAGATPGNLTLTLRYGTTTGGTQLCISAATALAASKTNISWFAEAWVSCHATGVSGTLLGMGRFMYDGAGAVFTTTSQNPLTFPASAPVAVTVDTTISAGIVLDATLGSASDGMTTQFLQFAALN